jgi:hypothetical protein
LESGIEFIYPLVEEEEAMKDRAALLQRRGFLFATVAWMASLFLPRGLSQNCVIRREVRFPFPMTRQQFENTSLSYCDPQAIHKHCQSMRNSGDLVAIAERFHPDRVVYDLTFKNADSSENYIKTIEQSWFDFEKFTEMGFTVSIDRIS